MRQIGILCAAAFVAVQENVGKLEGDHKNAKILAGRYTSPTWLTRHCHWWEEKLLPCFFLILFFNRSHVQLLETFFVLSLLISRRVESNKRNTSWCCFCGDQYSEYLSYQNFLSSYIMKTLEILVYLINTLILSFACELKLPFNRWYPTRKIFN